MSAKDKNPNAKIKRSLNGKARPLPRWRSVIRWSVWSVVTVFLAQPLILYWRPLMERNAKALLRENPNLSFTEDYWRPTSYHVWWISWANQLELLAPTKIKQVSGAPKTTDGDLAGIARVKNLEWLDLGRTRVSDKGLVHIRDLTNLRSLELPNTAITNEALDHIRVLKNLEWLNLRWTAITDDGIARIRDLRNLRRLDLTETGVTDNGLGEIACLTNLEWLDLDKTAVTDVGLKRISPLKNLRELYLYDTAVTAKGIEGLMKSINRLAVFQEPDAWAGGT